MSEAACPFCGVVAVGLAERVIGVPTQRLGRSAVFAFAATLAVTGCGGSTDVGDAGPADAATDAKPRADAGPDSGPPPEDGGIQPVYGAPPPQDGGIQPVYGAPPPQDGGGSFPIYGAAPPPPEK